MPEFLLTYCDEYSAWLIQNTLRASLLVAVIFLLQHFLVRWISPRWSYRLWFIPLLCLVMPAAPRSKLSVFNVFQNEPRATYSSVPLVPPLPSHAAVTVVAPTKNLEPIAERPIVTKRTTNWAVIFLAIWSCGFSALAGRLLLTHARFTKRISRLGRCTDPALLKQMEECKAKLDVKCRLEIIETALVQSPVLMGMLRPKLLLPRGIRDSFTKQELRFVFLHELAHLKQADIALNWISTLVLLLHWFNPVVWFGLSRMRADREIACDYLAVAAEEGQETIAYGMTILKLLRTSEAIHPMPILSGILETKHQLKRRFFMLNQFRTRRSASVSIAILLGLALTGLTAADHNGRGTQVASLRERRVEAMMHKLFTTMVPRLELQGTPVAQALAEIEKQSWDLGRQNGTDGVRILWQGKPLHTPVYLTVSNVPISEALRYVTELSGLTYHIEEHGVIIANEPDPEKRLETRDIELPAGVSPGNESATAFLTKAGIPFSPGSFALYKPLSNSLTVQCTPGTLAKIETVLATVPRKSKAELAAEYTKELNELISNPKGYLERQYVQFAPDATVTWRPQERLLVIRNTSANLYQQDEVLLQRFRGNEVASIDPANSLNLRLDATILPVIDFNNTSVTSALDQLSEASTRLNPGVSKLKILLDPSLPEPARRSMSEIRINLRLFDLPLREAIAFTTQLAGLGYAVTPEAVIILSEKAAKAKLITKEYKINEAP